jgi:hypothetical protein
MVRWQRFEEPISLPNGKQLFTLLDAGSYITKLPKAEHEAPEWQAAMEALMLVVTLGGPTMFARIGVMRALNRKSSACSIPIVRNITGAGGSWRGNMTASYVRVAALNGRRSDIAALPKSAITGRPLIADHFVGAKHPGFMSSGPRGSRLATRWHRCIFGAPIFGLTGKSKRNLINALK